MAPPVSLTDTGGKYREIRSRLQFITARRLFLLDRYSRGKATVGTAAVFIDGGYVDKVLHYDHNRQRVDYEKLVRMMVKPDDLLRAYYYHCMPYQSNPPSEDESRRYGATG